MIVAGLLFLAGRRWIETRALLALDMPISLARGTIRTGDFEINVHGFYSILIIRAAGGDLVCANGANLRTKRLSQISGHPIYRYPQDVDPTGRGIETNPFLGGFEGWPGHYDLDIEVISDTACLNAMGPRLMIVASDADFNEWNERYDNLCWMASIMAAGLILVLASIYETIRVRSEADDDYNLFAR